MRATRSAYLILLDLLPIAEVNPCRYFGFPLFINKSTTVLGPTQPPIQKGLKRLDREGDHSPSFTMFIEWIQINTNKAYEATNGKLNSQ